MLCNEKNLETRGFFFLLNQPAGLQAVHARHGHIEHDNIWVQSFHFIDGFEAIRRLAHYLPSRSAFE